MLGVRGCGCDWVAVGVEGNEEVELVFGASVEYALEYALGLGIAKFDGGAGTAGTVGDVAVVVGLDASGLTRLRFEGYLRRVESVAVGSGKGGSTFCRPPVVVAILIDGGDFGSSEASGVTGNGLLNVDVLDGVRTISDGSLEALV